MHPARQNIQISKYPYLQSYPRVPPPTLTLLPPDSIRPKIIKNLLIYKGTDSLHEERGKLIHIPNPLITPNLYNIRSNPFKHPIWEVNCVALVHIVIYVMPSVDSFLIREDYDTLMLQKVVKLAVEFFPRD